jgi:hypothetical protein
MSLIVPVNHLLPLLTTNQTHKKLAQNKNSCYFFISSFYVVHLCCSLIGPDQKVTAGALNALVVTVVECVRMLLGADGGVYLQELRRSSQ